MPRQHHAPLSQPIFGEPRFSEGTVTPDPSGFKTPHPSDNQIYKQIQDLLTKDVVGFDTARGKPGDLYTLEQAPIPAIPGNHDSFTIPETPTAAEPLKIFARNFCATEPVVAPEAASLHRTSMAQPGVYFTLDAPFARIIGLSSNALEDPGVISSEGGNWAGVPDLQLAYLTAQLQRAKSEKYKRAVLIRVHHPPFTYAPGAGGSGAGGNHSGSTTKLRNIDTICQAEGIYPHAFRSGHAHNDPHYDGPSIVCGDGGHDVDALVQANTSTQNPPSRPRDSCSNITMTATSAIWVSLSTSSSSASAFSKPGPPARRNRPSIWSPSIWPLTPWSPIEEPLRNRQLRYS
jgi:hypothetical protein